MTLSLLQSLEVLLPELVLLLGAMGLLMYGVFRGDKSLPAVTWGVVALMGVGLVLIWRQGAGSALLFDGMLQVDGFSQAAKQLILLGSALGAIMSLDYLKSQKLDRFEFPILIALSVVGMMIMVSASDFLALYLGLELQSLALYVMAAFHRDNLRSAESGMKYFVLGALSSGMLLHGISLLYGLTGSVGFASVTQVIGGSETVPIGVLFALVFVLAGLAFKVAAVPFHMWTPDVYEGAPTPVTAFFAVAPKIAAVALLLRVATGPFGDITDQWQQVIIFMSLASMILGSLVALVQTNIKRLMAYSSIGHAGYALVGLAAGSEDGYRAVMIYMAIYLFMNVGAFAVILAMRDKTGKLYENISDLAGLWKTRPGMAAALAIFMFSLAGIPPLAGFFGKFYVFLAAVEAGLYLLAIVGLLASVIGAYYYLRVIKVMFFDDPETILDAPVSVPMRVITGATALVTLLFMLYPAPITNLGSLAAQALSASGLGG